MFNTKNSFNLYIIDKSAVKSNNYEWCTRNQELHQNCGH